MKPQVSGYYLARTLAQVFGRSVAPIWVLLVMVSLSACQAPAPATLTRQESITITPTARQLPTVVIDVVPQATKDSDKDQLTDMAQAIVEPTKPAPISSPSSTLVAATATSAPTPTNMPTFTPPARPEPSPWDHFWLGRPVPQESAVWTDKAYPYGSTRGGQLRPHHGVEFNVPAGTPILASAAGTILFAGSDQSQTLGPELDFYGNVVVIQHDYSFAGQPLLTLYGHLSEIGVQAGQEVEAGAQIALSGASGVADGPHLHFEVRVGGNSYASTRNPLLWLYPFPDRGVVAGRITWPGGAPAIETPLRLERVDGPAPYAATTTYAAEGVNQDENWSENFAFDDVYAGYYRLIAGAGESKVEVEFWVFPRQTSFVEVVLGP